MVNSNFPTVKNTGPELAGFFELPARDPTAV
jgi:hypothetical protein